MNIGSDCKNLSNPQAIDPKNHKGYFQNHNHQDCLKKNNHYVD